MSWDTMYDDLEKSPCACGKGIVTRQSYSKMDDWNRTKDGYYDEKIECENCSLKFHIEHDIKHYFCPPWKGDGICDTPYLVPNDMTLKHNVEEKKFNFKLDEEIVSSFKIDTLEMVINDMKTNKFSTRLKLDDSSIIVNLYYHRYKKRSLDNIIILLEQCVYNYHSYEWTFDTVQAFKEEEQERIETNTMKNKDTISKSYKLEFKAK